MISIGELNEQSLHAGLKALYSCGKYTVEVRVDGFVIDVVRDHDLVEIQTAQFSSIKRKLTTLVEDHPLRLVYPIPQKKWLYKHPKPDWDGPRRRKSPKRGRVEQVFAELVSFPKLIAHPNFTLDVLLTWEEEEREFTGQGHWYKKGWVTTNRRLLAIADRKVFRAPQDFAPLLPDDLPPAFTTADLARTGKMPRPLAQKMAYCLREMDVIIQVGKRRRAFLYQRS